MTLNIIFLILKGLLGVFCFLSVIALINKPRSVYRYQRDQQNQFECKKVVFIADDRDDKNADGLNGHLEVIGDSQAVANKYQVLKRILDILLSFVGLVILAPVFFVITVAIVVDDPGPVFFVQKRVGKDKRFFKMHKFRSMRMDTPHNIPTHMLDNPEQYITKVGRFLRTHSLDELPQIWDIFIGNMSVIGPRPALWNQDYLIAERDKYDANSIKPGLTGLAQVSGRDELDICEKAKLDGEYVHNYCFFMDCKCFLRTIHVFKGDKSIVEGAAGK